VNSWTRSWSQPSRGQNRFPVSLTSFSAIKCASFKLLGERFYLSHLPIGKWFHRAWLVWLTFLFCKSNTDLNSIHCHKTTSVVIPT
jgi:hypothetical protein